LFNKEQQHLEFQYKWIKRNGYTTDLRGMERKRPLETCQFQVPRFEITLCWWLPFFPSVFGAEVAHDVVGNAIPHGADSIDW
jgi:hypothetical protein